MDEIRKLTNPEFSTISVTNGSHGAFYREEDEELITIFENETEEYREIIELETLKSDNESFDPSTLDMTQWDSVSADNNKALGFLWETGSQTFKTESGLEITVEKGSDIQVFENKETGEVIVVNADGAKISSNSNDVKLKIYDSEIDEINTGKGNDNIELHNSVINELNTGKGIDSISIQDSFVEDLNTGSGDDFVTSSNSTLENTNTSSTFLWGVFDSSSDTVILDDTNADSIKTGKGSDNIIISNSNITDLKSGGGDDALSIDETEVTNLSTDKKDTVVKDNNYLDFDKSKIQSIESDVQIQMEDGTTFALTEYTNYILNQDTTFETEEEYQEYTLQTLTENLETMKNIFAQQEDADGILANGYNGLKELTGLGITDEDIKQMIAEQEAMINGLTAALNGESDMTFEEAYEFYTGTSYSKEKLDKYMEVSNVYSAVMIGCQYDEDYADKFKEATGKSVEDVTKEYALCQMETFGKSNSLQKLVDKYAQDQEGFADKLSAVVSGLGITCMVVGAALSFVFPPAGMALLTAGKWISLGGMFVDNAMDLVDDSTDKDGLTKEELGENALETGVEAASYLAGRFIGGGMKGLKLGQTSFSGAFGEFVNGGTNGINSYVTQRLASSGFNAVGSQILGQVSETSLDMALSLCADYGITQAQSLITTGQFMDADDYWSVDRFLGEGKNQLMGIFTGLASTKVSLYQQSVMATAQGKILAGDVDGAKTYLHQKGMGMKDAKFDEFVAQLESAKPAPITSVDLETGEVASPSAPKIEASSTEIPETDVTSSSVKPKTETPVETDGAETVVKPTTETTVELDTPTVVTKTIEIPERTSKYQDLSIEEKRQLVNDRIEDKRLAGKFATYSDEKLAQVLDLKDMGLSEREILWTVNSNLNQQQFNTFVYMIDSGYKQADATYIAKVEPSKLDTAIELVNKGLRTSLLTEVLSLGNVEFNRATKLLDLGIDDHSIIKYSKDPIIYQKVVDILEAGLSDVTDGYEIQRRLNLSDSEFEAEIQKLNQIQSMRQESSVPAKINPIELSGDEVQELVTYLNKHGETCSTDDSIEDLAWKWEKVYRSSGYTPNVLNPKIEDAMIVRNKRYTMPDTETGGRSASSLNRWMYVDDMDSFINGLPEVGSVYSPNRIQSFSTMKHSAETHFSDFESRNNVKIVVLPANKTTSAFQIENKYNSDCEVVYPSTTQFRVLYKGVEEYPKDFSCDPAKGSHQMYTIYLEEVIPEAIITKPATEITTQDPNNHTNILKANGFSETDIASIIKGGETAYSRAIELAERNVDIGSIKDLSKLSDTQYKKALELIDSGVHPSYAKSIAKLSETEFKNYEKIVTNNISPANAIKLAKLSDTQITRALDLVSKGFPESRVADAAVLKGSQSAKVDTLLEQGVNPYYISQLAALDDSAYKIAMDLINNKGLNAATALDISTKKGSKLTDALEQVELGTYKEIKIELTAEAEAELLKQAELLYTNNSPYISKAEAEVAALLGDTGAILTARPKGIQSILNKLITKYEKGNINIGEGSTPETISAECKKAIGDFFGTRIQMQSLSEIKGSVTTALEETGLTFDEFIAHMKNGTIPEGLSKERFNEIKIIVAEKLKTQQTNAIVEQLVADITAGKIKITELNNYGSEVSSYFTDEQIIKIATAHYKATGELLTVVTKLQNSELEKTLYDDDGRAVGEAKTKGAEKDSGYTSTQMNVTHKLDKTTTGNGELQIRGTAVNIFGDVEHIPYDIRQGKITAKDVEYSEVYSTIKNMDDASYQKYNEYLAATYEWLRWQELGIETPQPKLEGTFTTKTGEVISPNDMAKLTMEGLTEIAKKTHS